MSERRVRIPALDGYALAAIVRTPVEARGVAIISGGTGFPKEVYGRFATYLVERGFVTITYDYRGMGESAPPSLKGFAARMREFGTLDQAGVIAWCERELPDLPLVLVGHSVGGQVLGMLPSLARVRRAAFIAASTGYWRRHPLPFRWYAAAFWFVHGPIMLRTLGYLPAKILWSGLAVPRGVFEEWRLWCSHPDYFFDVEPSLVERYGQVRVPIHAFCFTDDPIGTPEAVHRLVRRFTQAPVEVTWTSPHDVGVRRIGHEGFFRATHRETLWPKVGGWLAQL